MNAEKQALSILVLKRLHCAAKKFDNIREIHAFLCKTPCNYF